METKLVNEVNVMFENLAYELDCYDEEVLFETEAVVRKLNKVGIKYIYFIDMGTDYEYSFKKPGFVCKYKKLSLKEVKDIRIK
jgi:hypothetical protein